MTPAALTRRSSAPSSPNTAATWSARLTSITTSRTPGKGGQASISAWLIAVATTGRPCAAKGRDRAWPIPPAPPVTRTVRALISRRRKCGGEGVGVAERGGHGQGVGILMGGAAPPRDHLAPAGVPVLAGAGVRPTDAPR